MYLIFSWEMEEQLLKILENYIGLPICFQGVHLRLECANKKPIGKQLWHREGEERQIVKILIT